MKIGFSTSVIQRGKTGIAQHVLALLRAFQDQPAEHEFRLFVLEEDQSIFSRFDDRFQIVPVNEKFRPPIKNILWHQTKLPRLCRELDLDVIHVPSYRRLLWSRPSDGCARVCTIHDLAPFRVSGKYDLARMFYGRVVVKQLARRQEQIVAVSHNTASDIEEFFGIYRQRVRVIHNGLEHQRFYPCGRAHAHEFARTKFALFRPFFLYVARLEHPGKNHVRLIEAFERFKTQSRSDWILAFGGSDWRGAEVIHDRISRSPFKQDIRALGFIADEHLPMLYSAAEVFVYPSLYEGFGMPPVEAMACGCPVICSDRGSLGEVVADASRIIDPENVNSMAEALGDLHAGQGMRAQLIEKGLTRAKYFSWERAARETLSVYESLDQPAPRKSGTATRRLNRVAVSRG
jgi:glycosyltransferase involved in cell wall biosynthesis